VSLLGTLFSFTMMAATVRMAVPYACAALGGVTSERSGVVNVSLEGILLAAGFTSIAVQHRSGSALAGLVAGLAMGALFGLVHGVLAVVARIDAIVSGLALNLVAAGGTRFFLRALFDSSSNSATVAGFPTFGGTGGAASFARACLDPPTVLTVLAAVGLTFLLRDTRFGLRLRAAGEDPGAAARAGVPVVAVRLRALALGGALAGLGGVGLAFDQHQFQAGMSGGRGFIALAAVILSGWRPGPAVALSFAFASLDALQIVLQGQPWLPAGVVQSLPFAATLVALAFVGSRKGLGGMRPPAGIGKHA
jgi:ABC-type uncharacterized transport system permease subunit